MEHEVREPAWKIDMVPELLQHTILSARKFADA